MKNYVYQYNNNNNGHPNSHLSRGNLLLFHFQVPLPKSMALLSIL